MIFKLWAIEKLSFKVWCSVSQMSILWQALLNTQSFTIHLCEGICVLYGLKVYLIILYVVQWLLWIVSFLGYFYTKGKVLCTHCESMGIHIPQRNVALFLYIYYGNTNLNSIFLSSSPLTGSRNIIKYRCVCVCVCICAYMHCDKKIPEELASASYLKKQNKTHSLPIMARQ